MDGEMVKIHTNIHTDETVCCVHKSKRTKKNFCLGHNFVMDRREDSVTHTWTITLVL